MFFGGFYGCLFYLYPATRLKTSSAASAEGPKCKASVRTWNTKPWRRRGEAERSGVGWLGPAVFA